MNPITRLRNWIKSKSVPFYGGNYGYIGGPLDVYGKNRAPTPIELVGELLNTVYCCATLNEGLVASTKLRLYVRTTRRKAKSFIMDRGDSRPINRRERTRLESLKSVGQLVDSAGEVQEVTSHPVLDLLNRPNGNEIQENGVGLSRYTLFSITQLYLEVVGRAHWYVVRGKYGRPSAIWVLPAHLVQEIPDYSGEKIIKEYVYMGGGSTTTYKPQDIITFRTHNLYTAGYLDGWSPTRACFEQVRIFRQYAAHTSALLQNGAMPGAMFVPKGSAEGDPISPSEARRIRVAMQSQFAAAGRGGLLVSEYPGQIQPLTFKPGELMTPEQYKLQKVVIANTFQVPTTKIDRGEANLGSAQTGDYAHAKDAGLPRLRENESALSAFLLPMFEKDGGSEPQLFFAYDDPLGLRNESAEIERNKAFLQESPLMVNELRSELGYDPIPGGDVRFVPANMIGLNRAGEVVHDAVMPGALDVPTKSPIRPDKAPKKEKAFITEMALASEYVDER
jgi:phage portal protein BeeE